MFEITEQDIQQELTASYGTSSYLLEPGWHTLSVNEISVPLSQDGISKGYISFVDIESGISFRYYTTYGVMLDKDKWRVKQTKDLITRLCQVTGVGVAWRNMIGIPFRANVDVVSRTSKSKTEFDDLGMPKEVERKNNDFAKGKLTEIITPCDNELSFKL